jgi:hypothetical protein
MGPDIVLGDGTPVGKATSGWPQVADLSRRPAFPSGAVNGGPDWRDIIAEWRDKEGAGKDDLARALIEWGGRVLEQETESERAGLHEYAERLDHAWDLVHDVENARDRELGCGRGCSGLLRATLAAIRPQISGPIAEDADRALGVQFNAHETGDGELIRKHACQLGFEGVVSKTVDAPYAPGNRGLWRKSKCLNRQEFVVVGWTDPEGSRPYLGALLLGYYTDDARLTYAGRVGTGMADKVLADLRRRVEPLARATSPLSVPPPRETRFGSPLVLSRVHWVDPQLVAEITYLTWTADGLLRHTVYVGLRSDKPAREVRRETPRTK